MGCARCQTPGVKHVRFLGVVTAPAAIVVTALLLLWPLSEPGVTGSPLNPRYREFGWTSYVPLPENPSLSDLRRAGIPVPQDAVHRRRTEAAAAATLALAAFASWWTVGRRPHA
jgi:hypothetical protein